MVRVLRQLVLDGSGDQPEMSYEPFRSGAHRAREHDRL